MEWEEMIMEHIKQLAGGLRLSYLRKHCEEILLEAKHLSKSNEEFLIELLEKECETRRSNGIQRRIQDAKFPFKKYIEDFKIDRFPKDIQVKLKELMNLQFMEEKENIVCVSNPGMGKTHYAIGLGIKACLQSKKVLFVSVPNLILELREAMTRNQITQYKRKFEKYDLVILDELGYVSFDKDGSEILFNLISNRLQIGSMIITTNLSFDRWQEIFKDPVLTTAMVDRLAHKSHILNMNGDSYRVEETLEWLKSK